MDYLLILSGYEDDPLFWERLLANVPAIANCKLSILCYPELLWRHRKNDSENERNEWLQGVIDVASTHKINLKNGLKCVSDFSELEKPIEKSGCVVFSHVIFNELRTRKLLNKVGGSIISFDHNFNTVERCIIVFDRKVKSIVNFKKFFTHFAQTLKNVDVVLLIEMGNTLSEAAKNKKAVNYVISLFQSVGVITYVEKDLQNEIVRYVSLKENSVVIFNKSNYDTIIDPTFIERIQNKKIAYYLDEF